MQRWWQGLGNIAYPLMRITVAMEAKPMRPCLLDPKVHSELLDIFYADGNVATCNPPMSLLVCKWQQLDLDFWANWTLCQLSTYLFSPLTFAYG